MPQISAIQFHSDLPAWELPLPGETAEWVEMVAQKHRQKVQQLTYVFADDDYILYLNKKYLRHDYFTDILTFDYSVPGEGLHVDIFISVDRVRENACRFQCSFIDELHRVMIHGLLHTLGFDDHTEEQRAEMRRQEDLALALRMF